jgi:hypothetical protein
VIVSNPVIEGVRSVCENVAESVLVADSDLEIVGSDVTDSETESDGRTVGDVVEDFDSERESDDDGLVDAERSLLSVSDVETVFVPANVAVNVKV